jgi:hypothetical protein
MILLQLLFIAMSEKKWPRLSPSPSHGLESSFSYHPASRRMRPLVMTMMAMMTMMIVMAIVPVTVVHRVSTN